MVAKKRQKHYLTVGKNEKLSFVDVRQVRTKLSLFYLTLLGNSLLRDCN